MTQVNWIPRIYIHNHTHYMILEESAYVPILFTLLPHLVYLWSSSIKLSAWHIVVVQPTHVEHTWTAVVQELTCSEVLATEAKNQMGWSVIHKAEGASLGWGIHVHPNNYSLQSHRGDLKLKSLGLAHRLSAYEIKAPFVKHLFLKLDK